MENYLTIREIIEGNYFKDITLIGGESGLDNKAKNMVVLETPDGMNWLRGNEIVLTAGYAFIDHLENKKELIEVAQKRKVAAIGIKLGRYFGEIDNELIEKANENSIPIFVMKREAVYSEIVSNFYEGLFNKQNKNILQINTSYNKLLNLQTEDAGIEDIVKEVSKLTNLDVEFYRFYEIKEDSQGKIIPINFDDNTIGYLIINSCEELTEFQKNCVNYARSLIKNIIMLEQNLLLSRSVSHRMIAEIILSKQEIEERFLYNVKSYLNWDGKEYYGIFFKWLNKQKISNAKIRRIVEFSLDIKFLFSLAEENMIIFVPIKENELQNLLEKIKRGLPNKGKSIKIGISSKKSDLKELSKAYKEAKKICDISPKDISYLEKFPKEKVLLNFLENEENKEFFKNILDKLDEYDDKYNSQLVMTLREYLNNNLKHKDTAEKLHIHVETLRYRLNKIKDITGYDLNNSNDLMYLSMAMSIYEYI